MSKQLLVVYHSTTGGTHQMVQALARAAHCVENLTTTVKLAHQTEASDLIAADGYVFATPENLGSMSGMMKDFFDRTYYPVLEKLQGRPYGTLICAGSDGHGASRQIARIVTGWRLKAVQESVIVNVGAQTPEQIQAPKHLTPEQLTRCTELGELMGNGLVLSVF